ncbi:alpha/beta hydrolase [Pedobacter sp. MC2016-15]|uniref:alpha/beta hydrolase n=1 Tax=Pedobacter sp. MC2016-15 TaxID=2994473 RepID=UPI0022468E53|nr:alpha/beta hydrolase [Pedobacter sp. MC2016-15]MCX2480568.1 alpha/beta hydrolase [Pedobacter sp. MC2016-15]
METTTIDAGYQVQNYATDDHLSPQVREFLKGLNSGGPTVESLPPLEARKVLEGAQASVTFDYSAVTESEKTITADGFDIVLNIMRPKDAKGVLPVFIFIHGGGWILGDYPTHRRMVLDLVNNSGLCGVFINYTRTPDAAFPRAIEEIYAATKWVAEHGAEIEVDGSRLGVIGNSVGGNMTAVTCLKAKEKGGPDIKAAVMMWPIVDADFTTASYQKYGADRFLTTPLMKWMYDMYIPEPQNRSDIYASPLQATVEQLKGLPPTLIQVAENDVLCDEGEAYGRKLLEAGVEATTVRYNGVIHDFGLLNGLAHIPQTKDLFIQAAAQLSKYLK